jgi:bifunctional non-homologous end joining protein LigD
MVQWSTRPARNRRKPPGFIAPCLPVLVDEIPTGPSWMHELKWDGYRLIASRQTDRTHLWSRNALDWSASFPQIVEALGQLPVESITLDGEAV